MMKIMIKYGFMLSLIVSSCLSAMEQAEEIDTIRSGKNAFQSEVLEMAGRNLTDDTDEQHRSKKRKEQFDEDEEHLITLATKVYVQKEELWQGKIKELIALKNKLAGDASSADLDCIEKNLKAARYNLEVAQWDTNQARVEAINQIQALQKIKK